MIGGSADQRREVSLRAAFGMELEQQAMRDSLRSTLARHERGAVPPTTATDTPGSGLWSQLADLGLAGLLIPERFGGAGLRLVDAVVALEQTGRDLSEGPMLSSVAASAALLDAGGPDTWERYLPPIAEGRSTAALALGENDGWTPGGIATRAERASMGWRLSGSKSLVLDGAAAEILLVAARDDEGLGLFAVERSAAPGMEAVVLPGLDETRSLADLAFDGVPAVRLRSGDQLAAIERSRDVAIVLVAAEQVGAAQRMLEIAVEHAKSRIQFDRPIGSFQAIKHRCADMLIEVEYARAAAYYAGWAATSEPEELPVLSGVLKSTVAEAFLSAATSTIQILGGLGYSWEHPAHRYYKRAVGDRLLFGSPEDEQDRTADLLGY